MKSSKSELKYKEKLWFWGFFACRAEVEFTCDFLEGVNSTSGGCSAMMAV